MRTDLEIFRKAAADLSKAGGGAFGSLTEATLAWAVNHGLPAELIELFQQMIPKAELWAGAGVLFEEERMVHWNENLPEALENGFLIVGSAANGDHIAIELRTGSVGYISHEQHWQKNPREFFVAVSRSIGLFLRDSNDSAAPVPDDYWDAKTRLP